MIINNIGSSRRDADTLNGKNSAQFATAAQGSKADLAAIAAGGTNATGTWPIAISGSAATAVKLLTARTLSMSGDISGSGSFDGTSNLNITTSFGANATAPMATKLATARTITVTGGATSSATPFDGTSNISLNITVDPTKHVHTITQVTNLRNELDLLSGKIDEIDAIVTGGTISQLGTAAIKNVGLSAGNVPEVQSNGKLSPQLIPDDAKSVYYAVAGLPELLATNAKQWQLASRADTSKTYILATADPTQSVNWKELPTPPAPVTSVANRTGAIILTKSDVGLGSVDNTSDASKNVLTATKWITARTISITGDVTGNTSIDGSANASIAATLKNSGVTAGTYRSVTVDSKGIVTSGSNPTTLVGYGISDAAPINSPVFTGEPKVPTAVPNTNTTQIASTEFVTTALLNKTSVSGNAGTATRLATPRSINGVFFDGTNNISIMAPANGGTSAACSGNAATATKLETARTINGVTFDGTASITITAVANGGNAATVGGYAPSTSSTVNSVAVRDSNGYLYASRVYNAVFNDYAELFKKDLENYLEEDYEEGTLLETDGRGHVIPSQKIGSKRVIGAVSHSYGSLMGGTEDQDYNKIHFVPVGLAGRIPVKVVGIIEPGDLLYASDIPGFACNLPHTPGTCIGKALEYNYNDKGIVEMLIMLS